MNNAAMHLWRHAGSESVACIDDGQPTTYTKLVAMASAVAGDLQKAGVRAGDRVAVCLERGPLAIAAYYGACAAGAVVVMVNDTLRPRQIETMLADCEPRLLMTSASILSRHPRPLATQTTVVDIAEIALNGTAADVVDRDASDPAQIIYTSGSSGLPKGVVLSHGNLEANTRIVSGYLGLRSTDRTLSLLPFSSVFGINQVLCTVGTAGTLVIERSPLAAQMVSTMRAEQITVVAAVPPLWGQILKAPDFHDQIASLRVLQSAGGYLPVSAVKTIRAAQPQAQLFIMYGMTEVMRSTYLPPDEVDARPDSMGRAMPETEVIVVRDDDSECGVNETGQLVHSGPTAALGYWRRPDATAQTFRVHPKDPARRAVYSGDLVKRDEAGYLYFVSRSDRLIKTLGNRVGPDEITDVLLASMHVTEAAVTSEPDSIRGERIIAHVVLEPHGSLSQLQVFCKTEMPRWMYPARFVVHESLPRLANGKYDLHALRELSAHSGSDAN